MERRGLGSMTKRTVTVSLRTDLVSEARRLGVDISEACERGLVEAASKAWLDENRNAIESSNAYVEEHGPPFARYRQF
jgi:antitoxin CcdA